MSITERILAIAGSCGGVLLYPTLCFLVAKSATGYKRSPFAWFMLAVFSTPIVAYVYLLIADTPHSAMVPVPTPPSGMATARRVSPR